MQARRRAQDLSGSDHEPPQKKRKLDNKAEDHVQALKEEIDAQKQQIQEMMKELAQKESTLQQGLESEEETKGKGQKRRHEDADSADAAGPAKRARKMSAKVRTNLLCCQQQDFTTEFCLRRRRSPRRQQRASSGGTRTPLPRSSAALPQR